jgi:hypothetical protein
MKITEVPSVTPKGLPPARPSRAAEARTGDEPVAVWERLVPHVVSPIEVAIIEALLWIQEPLSATDLSKSFSHRSYYARLVNHHASTLEEFGVVEVVGHRKVRGATEIFYFFAAR